jgi:protein tyrosine phosphatase
MHSLYVNNSLDICEAGPKSGKSAAHQAAEKGHAAAGSGENFSASCEAVNHITTGDLSAEQCEQRGSQYITQYALKVSKDGQERLITLNHYRNWPDHGVPSDFDDINTLKKLIDIVSKNTKEEALIVHCSAGVGRTGTFMACHYHTVGKQQGVRKDFIYDTVDKEVGELVLRMRSQRPGCVQEDRQLQFIRTFLLGKEGLE